VDSYIRIALSVVAKLLVLKLDIRDVSVVRMWFVGNYVFMFVDDIALVDCSGHTSIKYSYIVGLYFVYPYLYPYVRIKFQLTNCNDSVHKRNRTYKNKCYQ